MENNIDSGITITDIIQMVWRNIILLSLITVGCIALGLVYVVRFQTPMYQSRGSIMVQMKPDNTGESGIDIINSLRITNTIADLFKENVILDAVREKLESKEIKTTNAKLRENVSVVPGTNSLFVYISFVDKTPEEAQIITNVFLEIIIAQQSKFPSLKDTMEISSTAELGARYAPSKLKFLISACILGLVIGFVIIMLKELLRNVIRNEDDLRSITNLNVIGKISYVPEEDLNA